MLFLFSRFIDFKERKLAKNIINIGFKSKDRSLKASHKLITENHLALCLEVEYLFKGYSILNKNNRKKAFLNINKINNDFLRFYENHKNLKFNDQSSSEFNYLYIISKYLKPNSKFNYQEGASVYKTLMFENDIKFQADCNQLVNLYIHLFSLKYDVKKLKIKLLKDHVCLHFEDYDFETTNAQITKYEKFINISDVSEIISVNILDINDSDLKTSNIHVKDFYAGCRIAKNLSSNTKITEHNIKVAYQKMAKHYEQINDYKKAEYFIKILKNKDELINFYKRYCQYLISKKQFKKAIKKAKKTKDSQFTSYVYSSFVQFLLNEKKFEAALKFAKKSKIDNLIEFAASKLYNNFYSKIKRDGSKNYNKKLYKKMLKVAYLLKDQKLIDGLKKNIKYLN